MNLHSIHGKGRQIVLHAPDRDLQCMALILVHGQSIWQIVIIDLRRCKCIIHSLKLLDLHSHHDTLIIFLRNLNACRQILTDIYRILHTSGLAFRIQCFRRDLQV